MKIRVEIISETDDSKVPESARRTVDVQTHSRRGDMFNIDKSDSVIEGNDMVFNVPAGGRLVINTPQVREDLVYDRDQAASIRMSNQVNTEMRADAPNLEQIAKDKQAEADVAKRQAEQAQKPVSPDKSAPAPTGTNTASGQPAPAGVKVDTQGRPNPTDMARVQQNAPRPAGEKAPLPGSPVGSPPAGNEGKK